MRHRDTNGPFGNRRELKSVAAARTQGVRAVRRVPADRRRRRSAGCLERAPGGLLGGAPDPDPDRRRGRRPDRQHGGAPVAPARRLRRRRLSGCRPSPTSSAELEKPGRDPRPAFATAAFADGVEKVADLRVGMVLEGVVTNVAAFGAFVDVGVHQDGLVHVSAMSRSFVSDPRQVVTSGQVVKVKVMEVDEARQADLAQFAAGRRARSTGGAAWRTTIGPQSPGPGERGRATARETSRRPGKTGGEAGSGRGWSDGGGAPPGRAWATEPLTRKASVVRPATLLDGLFWRTGVLGRQAGHQLSVDPAADLGQLPHLNCGQGVEDEVPHRVHVAGC